MPKYVVFGEEVLETLSKHSYLCYILTPSKEASCIGPVTSLGSLVNCVHLIGYCLSLPPRV